MTSDAGKPRRRRPAAPRPGAIPEAREASPEDIDTQFLRLDSTDSDSAAAARQRIRKLRPAIRKGMECAVVWCESGQCCVGVVYATGGRLLFALVGLNEIATYGGSGWLDGDLYEQGPERFYQCKCDGGLRQLDLRLLLPQTSATPGRPTRVPVASIKSSMLGDGRPMEPHWGAVPLAKLEKARRNENPSQRRTEAGAAEWRLNTRHPGAVDRIRAEAAEWRRLNPDDD